MAWLRRAVPKVARASVQLEPGDHIVTWSRTPTVDGSAYLVATQRALYFDDHFGHGRIPWDAIVKANWDEPMLQLVIQPNGAGTPQVVQVQLDEEGQLPTTVRERVTASILLTERVLLEGNKGALLVARKNSDTGAIRWNVVFDSGLDPANPELRRRADDMVAALSTQLGI